ncbi:RNase adapter RapZ [Desulfuromonas carbonis]|uniref:RNase adapter RapZ n=1 Tax=Desulfuromonas sp. DDH964 TaxID=1823759 RepID=UPI00078CE8E6|nr:RNase adapter RapZ [Desulfuromonas sp. DDH964]AMV72564.1 glmZ(sRNA)-inactivating NTPase [Desulfuromonas sp. DDH964]
MTQKRLIIITGLSGSGKTTAARALEDEGFFVVDNLPIPLLPRLLEISPAAASAGGDVAIVLDIRNRSFLAASETVFAEIRQAGYRLEILFFEASDEILLRRYSETRRRHPVGGGVGVLDSIHRERELLAGLRGQATMITDSSQLTPHLLRARVTALVLGGNDATPLAVLVQSFGFRYGIPPGTDLLMDVRFLPNPHFHPDLRGQTGLDPAVRDFIFDQEICREFLDRFRDLLQFLLPHYRQEGKSYLTISIGCTGGRHRSVALAEALSPLIAGTGITVQTTHRDLDKG